MCGGNNERNIKQASSLHVVPKDTNSAARRYGLPRRLPVVQRLSDRGHAIACRQDVSATTAYSRLRMCSMRLSELEDETQREVRRMGPHYRRAVPVDIHIWTQPSPGNRRCVHGRNGYTLQPLRIFLAQLDSRRRPISPSVPTVAGPRRRNQ